MENKIITRLFRPYLLFFAYYISFSIVLTILIIIATKLNSEFLVIGLLLTGFLSLVFVPMIYKKEVHNYFTKCAELNFDADTFIIKVQGKNNNFTKNEFRFYWNAIKGYRLSYLSTGYTILEIFSEGDFFKKKFFLKEDTIDGKLSIKNVFIKYCRVYNYKNSTGRTIILFPGFMTTQVGTICLWALGIFNFLIVIIAIIKKSNRILYFSFSIFILIQLIGIRISDRKTYNELMNYKIIED